MLMERIRGEMYPMPHAPDGFLAAQQIIRIMDAADLDEWYLIADIEDIRDDYFGLELREAFMHQSRVTEALRGFDDTVHASEHMAQMLQQKYQAYLESGVSDINQFLQNHTGIMQALITPQSVEWVAVSALRVGPGLNSLPVVRYVVDDADHSQLSYVRYDVGALTPGEKRSLLGYNE